MPDRRQGDRRETSVLKKNIAISLSSFIYLCIIFVLTIVSIVACRILSVKNYNTGYEEGYAHGYSFACELNGFEDITK